jgi:DNA-binding MarR family transcriptional regulator
VKTNSNTADIADRLHSVAIHLLRSVRVYDSGSGLSPARLSALSVIVYSQDVTVSHVAAAEQVRVPTMSRLITDMEHDGLVKRSPSPHDARAWRITATTEGKRALQRGRDLRLAALEQSLASCAPSEIDTLRDAVSTLERLFGHPLSGVDPE